MTSSTLGHHVALQHVVNVLCPDRAVGALALRRLQALPAQAEKDGSRNECR